MFNHVCTETFTSDSGAKVWCWKRRNDQDLSMSLSFMVVYSNLLFSKNWGAAQIVILNVFHPSCPPAAENTFNLSSFQWAWAHLVHNHKNSDFWLPRRTTIKGFVEPSLVTAKEMSTITDYSIHITKTHISKGQNGDKINEQWRKKTYL